MKVYEELVRSAKSSGLNVIVELKKEEEAIFVSKSGCQGFCQIGPLVTVLPEGLFYTRVRPEDVQEIVDSTLKKASPLKGFSIRNRRREGSARPRKRYPSIKSKNGSS